jgi:glycosyltransferase involved in cell wall biosynthesis
MQKVSILIPSRLGQKKSGAEGSLLIEGAIESIRSQTMASRVNFQIVVGIDAGATIPSKLSANSALQFAEGARSQAAALNAAAKLITGDFVAILEDDDQWQPKFLEHAISALDKTDFVSSTQLEIGLDETIIRISDYPTPSGWVMNRKTWQSVGGFNEKFRWHLDSDWLGRLTERRFSRVHLVEATAPIHPQIAALVRPCLANCFRFAGSTLRLVRHDSPWPLVKRLRRPDSGMQKISTNPLFSIASQNEKKALAQRYGGIPW